MIHNFFIGIPLPVVTLCALAGSILQWTSHTTASPESIQQLVQTIARDRIVKGAITDLLRGSIEQRVPELVDQVPGLHMKLRKTIGTGVNTVIFSPEVQSVWEPMLNDSRETLPKDLVEYGSGRTRTPSSARVNLDPLIS